MNVAAQRSKLKDIKRQIALKMRVWFLKKWKNEVEFIKKERIALEEKQDQVLTSYLKIKYGKIFIKALRLNREEMIENREKDIFKK